MHRSLVGPWGRLVAGKGKLLERIAGIDPTPRQRRPGPDRWSIIEVLEHVVIVETGIASALMRDPSPDRPRRFAGRWWRYPALRVVLGLGIRIRLPVESIAPTGNAEWEELQARWTEGRERFRHWLDGVEPPTLATPRFRHPLAGWLDLPQGVTFAGDHLTHHLPQVERVLTALERGP
ncbi:MAG: DinB family protein [Actinomycetota bacterium]|nr:DinB family protein [Actinomycetota bacterium]